MSKSEWQEAWQRHAHIARRTQELIAAMVTAILDETAQAPDEIEVHNGNTPEFIYDGKVCRTSVQYFEPEDKFIVQAEVLVYAQTWESPAEYDWKDLASYESADDAISEAIAYGNTQYETPED